MRTTTRRQFKSDDALYDVEYGTPAGQIQFVYENIAMMKNSHVY